MNKANSLNLFNNPFNFSTAAETWSSSKSTRAVSIFKTIQSAAYDLYIKNPYEITIGNITKISRHSTSLTITQKIASGVLVSLGACYSAMLYGFGVYSLGGGIHTLGQALNSPLLLSTSRITSSFGEKLFLTGAVPIYAIGYALPKFVIQNTPKAIEKFALEINKAATWVFVNVITPIFQVAQHVIRWTVSKVTMALKTLATSISKAASWVFVNVITPIFQVAQQVIRWTISKVTMALKTLATSISKAASWVFVNVITPIFQVAQHVIRWTISKVTMALKTLATSISKAATWVFVNVITPIFQAAQQAIRWTISKITMALKTLATSISKVASWVFVNVITPLIRGITDTFDTLINRLIYPISSGIWEGIQNASYKISTFTQTLFENTIIPLSKALNAAFTQTISKSYELVESIQNSLSELLAKLERIFLAQTSTSFIP